MNDIESTKPRVARARTAGSIIMAVAGRVIWESPTHGQPTAYCTAYLLIVHFLRAANLKGLDSVGRWCCMIVKVLH